MRNERRVLHLFVSAVLLFSTGCAILTRTQRKEVRRETTRRYIVVSLRDSENPEIVYSRILVEDVSYIEALNREIRAKRARSWWSQKRHIGFFGSLKETRQEIGVKLVFPW